MLHLFFPAFIPATVGRFLLKHKHQKIIIGTKYLQGRGEELLFFTETGLLFITWILQYRFCSQGLKNNFCSRNRCSSI